MTRVLFLMPTGSVIGGVETWLDRASAYFSNHGLEPVVGLLRGQRFNQPDLYKEKHPGLDSVEVDGRGLNREGRIRALVRCIRDVQPDLVVPLGVVDANEAVIRAKQRGRSVRLVGNAQGNLEQMIADFASYRDWFDLVVCPGKLTQNVLIHWAGFSSQRVINIPNGANEPLRRRRQRDPGEPLRIGWVGRMTEVDKRALDLIPFNDELTRSDISYRLDIVGDGPCRLELERSLKGVTPQVRFHGALSHGELYENVFPDLDVLFMSSSSEAFGIVLVEAMMHGVVPVSSRYTGFHSERLVVDDVTGLSFEVGDMRSAADAVRRLSDDSVLLRRLAENGEDHARQYTWSRSLGQWEAALVDAASRAPVGGGPIPRVKLAPGRLDRTGLPPGVVDWLRRLRRATLGSPVAAGGEEWPLFYRHHPDTVLEAVRAALRTYDSTEYVSTDAEAPEDFSLSNQRSLGRKC